jgi:quercetin dioxygenase-like cupin family protein
MRFGSGAACALIAAALGGSATAQDKGVARPNLLLEQIVSTMPRDADQSVRILTATFKPGDRTVTHTHRFPVGVYVLEGVFTLELKGQAPLSVKAGEAILEPAQIEMTGYNRSATDPTRVVIFYVSTPGMPFLDLMH